ncbi:hypothetical protein B0H11DRAFT_2001350 [Mycena galericulata]|nr:hypothetical protein B0H11DRAFT_2012736 [Mycena galericulata]KAJ7495972.1 hypothetical protein B0H11DRAFT_2001350 [Mycena galericulata]
MALSSVTDPARKTECKKALESVQAKIMDPSMMSIDVMRALARAHDIPLPLSSDRSAVFRALSTHRSFGAEPRLRLLLVPQSETAPLTQHELHRGPDLHQQIANLLGCTSPRAILLHAEDQIAYARGRSAGVGVGRLHTSYEAWLDADTSAGHPVNTRACDLLQMPNLYGPIFGSENNFYQVSRHSIVDIARYSQLRQAG